MNRLKKILFPTDFSRGAEQAQAHAVAFAEKQDAELHLLHAVVLHGYDPYNPDFNLVEVEEEILKSLQEDASRRMAATVDADLEQKLTVVRAERRGVSPAPVILDYADEHDIDLIVMGTQGRRGLGQLFLGSVAEEVVRRAKCSVMTVREQKEPKPPSDMDTLLVPIDFSEHSRRALAYAKRIAASYEARLQLLHVVEQMIHPSFYAIGKTSILDLDPDIIGRSKREMERWLQEAGAPDVLAESFVIDGRATRDIVKFAEDHDSDLIVIATHGLTGIDRFLMGSVTQKVVRRSPCPVFTVKSFGRQLLD